MLAPNMATMLALCTTDAAVDPDTLQAALRAAVDVSFNAHDGGRLHLDQRHRAGPGQRAGRDALARRR